MEVISHRGYWKEQHEKNTPLAFVRSFECGFGTETDIRDFNGHLVISHDMPSSTSDCITVQEFFRIYKEYGDRLPLALNIKADGLQSNLKKLLQEFGIDNYFVFDMSVPDGLGYLKNNMRVYTRQSEYESHPPFYSQAEGVWLDEFYSHWINEEVFSAHTKARKKICIVSPELHKRDHTQEWRDYKNLISKCDYSGMMICTDLPELARTYFNGD